MPFDGTEAKFVKPEVFSLEGLVAWLETQEPERRYDWDDCNGGCLIGIYYAAHGVSEDRSYTDVFGVDWVTSYGLVCSSGAGPTTFGAALTRARQLLATA